MKVRDIMERDVLVVRNGTTYEEAAKMLHDKGCGSAPVVDEAGKLVGIVSERDLFRILFPFYRSFYENPELYVDFENRECKIVEVRAKPVEIFMTKEVAYVTPEMPIMRAGSLILARQVRTLPVLENGDIVGTITWKRVYQELVKNKFGI